MAIATGADLATLRAAGASETRIREIVWGMLRWRFRDAQTTKRVNRIQRGWWMDDQRTLAITRASQWLTDTNASTCARVVC
jgi:hypothetical protein